jgi:hypothetical protein
METLVRVDEAWKRLDRAESELEAMREELRQALRAAHERGASYALLGRMRGLSRERIRKLATG